MDHSPAFLALVNEARQHVREISIAETRERLANDPNVHLVDIREDSEWAQGRAAGATHIGRGVIERDIERLIPDKNAEIILYCGGGYRSLLSADSLQKMGYTNVTSMAEGWRGWRNSGAPTE
jgi:rhodanese-related sulfurtransferase